MTHSSYPQSFSNHPAIITGAVFTMTQEIIEQLEQKLGEILRILHMPDIKGIEMREFTFELIQMSKSR